MFGDIKLKKGSKVEGAAGFEKITGKSLARFIQTNFIRAVPEG
jgi:hypothetical protein